MKTMIKRINGLEFYLSLVLIGIIGLLCYAPLINQLGYYKEDWIVIWAGLTQGPKFLIPVFEVDRPLIGYLYALLYPLIGNQVLSWQFYTLAIRLITAYGLFWLLRIIWPEERLITTTITLLFLVYPGFLQQPQAVIFQAHLSSLMLAIFSIALTIYSTRIQNLAIIVLANIIAIIMAAIYPMLMEYYIGLESLRVLLLWYVLRRGSSRLLSEDLRRLLIRVSPYFLSIAAFLYWRLLVFKGTRPTFDVDRLYTHYFSSGIHIIYRLVIELSRDIWETTLFAWTVPLERFLYWGSYRQAISAVFLAVVTVLFIGLYYKYLRQTDALGANAMKDNGLSANLIWIGGLSIIFALIPVIAANQDVNFDLIRRMDRFSLPASIGVAFFICGLVIFACRSRSRIWIIFLLIGLSIVAHYQHTLYMQDLWNVQRQVWWQLSWRAPQLKEKTLLFISLPANFGYVGEADIWAPANMIYYRQPGPPTITAEVFVQQTAFDLIKGVQKSRSYRNVLVDKNFNNSLIMSMPNLTSCLHVIDGKKSEFSGEEDPLVRLLASFSKIDRIVTTPPFVQPPTDIFGQEPSHTWCYYYQKAAFARQVGDWEEIARLGDEARDKGFSPGDPSEWMPFLEGYASIGREKEAKQLAINIKSDPYVKFTICNQLGSPPPYSGSYDYEKVVSLLCISE